MVQRTLKMVQKRCGGALRNHGGAPRRLGGVHFSPRGASAGPRSGLLSARSLVSGPSVVHRSVRGVHFSSSPSISTPGGAAGRRKSVS